MKKIFTFLFILFLFYTPFEIKARCTIGVKEHLSFKGAVDFAGYAFYRLFQ